GPFAGREGDDRNLACIYARDGENVANGIISINRSISERVRNASQPAKVVIDIVDGAIAYREIHGVTLLPGYRHDNVSGTRPRRYLGHNSHVAPAGGSGRSSIKCNRARSLGSTEVGTRDSHGSSHSGGDGRDIS